ncbi:MAG: glycosyltransferase [Gemmatimonadales bacterium]
MTSPGGLSRPSMQWAILTPEFPPASGGVSDYSSLVAKSLLAAGDTVSVWFPGSTKQEQRQGTPWLIPLQKGFRLSGLNLLLRDLDALPPDARVLLQYAPHAFGYKGMNIPIVRALSRFNRNPLDVMFHEVAYPRLRGDTVRHQALSIVQFSMARQIAARADRIFVSTEAWRPVLAPWARDPASIVWLPVPSNLPKRVRPEDTAAARLSLGVSNGTILGHFSTYAPGITAFLSASVPSLLHADASRACVLMGRGARNFRNAMSLANPAISSQLFSFEGSPALELAGFISACDVMLQPYPDGVTGRRTTVMAAIALGVPTVTTNGVLTEDIWKESGGVALSPAHMTTAFAPTVEELVRNAVIRARLGRAGKRLYEAAFDVSHTARLLRQI